MKTLSSAWRFPLAALLAALCAACASAPGDVAKIELTGTVGAAVSGDYIQNGTAQEFHGVLPLTLYQPGVTQVTLRKDDPGTSLTLKVRAGARIASTTSPAGVKDGLRAELTGNWNVTTVPPAK